RLHNPCRSHRISPALDEHRVVVTEPPAQSKATLQVPEGVLGEIENPADLARQAPLNGARDVEVHRRSSLFESPDMLECTKVGRSHPFRPLGDHRDSHTSWRGVGTLSDDTVPAPKPPAQTARVQSPALVVGRDAI